MEFDTTYNATTTTSSLSSGEAAAVSIIGLIIMMVVFALVAIPSIVVWWKLFTKAGKPGWAAIIPIYNTYTMTEIAKAPIMYFVLTLMPFVSIVGIILILVELSKQYSKPVTIWLAALFPIVALFMVKNTEYIGGGVVPQQPVGPTPPTNFTPPAGPTQPPIQPVQ